MIGMYAVAGTVRFDWYDYQPLDDIPGVPEAV